MENGGGIGVRGMGRKALERDEVLKSGMGKVYGPCHPKS
jgi:hypothetical protein